MWPFLEEYSNSRDVMRMIALLIDGLRKGTATVRKKAVVRRA